MNLQHTHKSNPFTARSFPITIVCDGVQSPGNLGSLFRLADAFGVKNIVLCGPQIDLETPRLRKAARSTKSALNIEHYDSTAIYIEQLDSPRYITIALESTSKSLALHTITLPDDAPLVLFVGNESSGVSQQVLDWVQHTLHIEMFGLNSSMNVTQATGIALYELTQKLLGQR